MAINRFQSPAQQQISKDWFSPDMGLLAAALQQSQADHNKNEARIAKFDEFLFNHLQADTPRSQEVYDELASLSDELYKGLKGDGDLRGLNFRLSEEERKLKRRMRPEEDIGKMIYNYSSYQEHMKLLDELFKDEKLSAARKNAIASKMLKDYEAQGGIGEKDKEGNYQNLNTIDPEAYVDIPTFLDEMGQGFKADSYENVAKDENGKPVNGARWYDAGRIWKQTESGMEEVSFTEVANYLTSSLMNNDKAQRYLAQLQDLGMLEKENSLENLFVLDKKKNYVLNVEGNKFASQIFNAANKYSYEKLSFKENIKFDAFDVKKYGFDLEQAAENEFEILPSTVQQTSKTLTAIRKEMTGFAAKRTSAQRVVSKYKELKRARPLTKVEKQEYSDALSQLSVAKAEIQSREKLMERVVTENKSKLTEPLNNLKGLLKDPSEANEIMAMIMDGSLQKLYEKQARKLFDKSFDPSDGRNARSPENLKKLLNSKDAGFTKFTFLKDGKNLHDLMEAAGYGTTYSFGRSGRPVFQFIEPKWEPELRQQYEDKPIEYRQDMEVIRSTKGVTKRMENAVLKGIANGSVAITGADGALFNKNNPELTTAINEGKADVEMIVDPNLTGGKPQMNLTYTTEDGDRVTQPIQFTDDATGERLMDQYIQEGLSVAQNPNFAKRDTDGVPMRDPNNPNRYLLNERGRKARRTAFYLRGSSYKVKTPEGATTGVNLHQALLAENLLNLNKNQSVYIDFTPSAKIKVVSASPGKFFVSYVDQDGNELGNINDVDGVQSIRGIIENVGEDLSTAGY